MAVEITTKFIIKTFGTKSAKEIEKIIEAALWSSSEIRDVIMLEFDTDLPEIEKTISEKTMERLNELTEKDFKENPYRPKRQT